MENGKQAQNTGEMQEHESTVQTQSKDKDEQNDRDKKKKDLKWKLMDQRKMIQDRADQAATTVNVDIIQNGDMSDDLLKLSHKRKNVNDGQENAKA